jgi:hypothetical protein
VSPKRKTSRRWRGVHLTPIGEEILRQIDAGTYVFADKAAIARANIANVNARRARK